MIDVADLRRSYQQGGLDESELPSHPMDLFEKWLQQAIDSKMYDPNSVVVSTVDEQGQPYSRMVLLKDYDRENMQGTPYCMSWVPDWGKTEPSGRYRTQSSVRR